MTRSDPPAPGDSSPTPEEPDREALANRSTCVSGIPPLDHLPEEFGRYRILQFLGRGGMGEVYLARDKVLDREVALKILRFGRADSERVQRFYREARVAAGLAHPNLCPLFDVGELGGIHYLTMPRLRGESLADRLRREGRLPPAEAARLTAQVARAVHVAHQAGVVHRDLKPSNVMIDEAGQPIVLDFGLAVRQSSSDPRLTDPGVVAGTPAYVAPERIGGEPDGPGFAGDVYSLGVLLYECLTGQLPFRGTVGQVLCQALAETPPPPSQLCPGLDPHLEAACLKALARDRADRFASMEDFARALEVIQPEAPPPARKPRRWVLVGVMLVLLALVGGLVWTFGGRGDPFGPGASWEGEFHFGGRTGILDGALRVNITEREGETFRGTYVANPGNYGWHIEGTVRGNDVEWGFTAVLEGTKENAALVGQGRVTATRHGNELTGRFDDPSDKPPTMATIALRRTR